MMEIHRVTLPSSPEVPTDAVSCCTTVRVPTESVTPARQGQWGEVFYLPNVAIHTHVLPNGKVLFWGRRDKPDGSMDENECTPFLWDPEERTFSLQDGHGDN